MSDLTFTLADVKPAATARRSQATAAEEIPPGMPVYLDDGEAKQADATTEPKSRAAGISVNHARAGQPLDFVVAGQVEFGEGVLEPGEHYIVSHNAGGIKPTRDLANGEFGAHLGIALDDATLDVRLHTPGIAYEEAAS